MGLKCENSANNSYLWMRLQNNMPGIRFEFFFLHSISKIVDFYLCWFCWLCVSWHILTGRQVLFGLPIITYFFIFPECYFFAYVMSGFFNQVLYSFFYNSDDVKGTIERGFLLTLNWKLTREWLHIIVQIEVLYIGGIHKPRSH